MDLVVSNVSHCFFQDHETAYILRDISFSVEKGEFVSILGPSGCGKTTLLSIIAGLLKPTEGTVQKQEQIGYMLQHDFLFPWKTIGDNCGLGLKLMGKRMSESKQIVAELLAKVGLSDTAHLYPRQLSGGMRQRAALVRTLITDPQLLLLDESFSALDYQNKLRLEDIVSQLLHRTNKTAVLVTHDIEEAIAMSDRILLLSKGPSTIQKVIVIPEELRALSPLEARKHPQFLILREEIWKELTEIEAAEN